MAIKYAIEDHVVAFVSKALAREGGKHIYNVEIDKDHDNGDWIGRGDFVDLDLYKEAEPGNATGKVVMQAENGNYYVEIKSVDEDTLFVRSVPVIAETYNREFQEESKFYNAKGDTVRAYELAHGDIVELSALHFGDTAPEIGAEVSLKDGRFTTA
jgi:hypothetical protein